MQKLKTRVVKKNLNPEWNEDLTLSISDPRTPISLVSNFSSNSVCGLKSKFRLITEMKFACSDFLTDAYHYYYHMTVIKICTQKNDSNQDETF